jgi:hypothetical protein
VHSQVGRRSCCGRRRGQAGLVWQVSGHRAGCRKGG